MPTNEQIEKVAKAISEAHELHGRSFTMMARAALSAAAGNAEQKKNDRAAVQRGEASQAEFDRIYAHPPALEPVKASPEVQAWEAFCDASYYYMWCVRPVGETTFGKGYHLINGDEAKDLAARLSTLPPLTT
jgi:hypothetical protein